MRNRAPCNCARFGGGAGRDGLELRQFHNCTTLQINGNAACTGGVLRVKQLEVRQRLLQLLPRDAEAHGRKVDFEVLTGEDVASVLLQAAGRHCVDVICLGTYGTSGLKKALMGSVTREVMARTDRPVMVVHPPEG